VKWLLFDSLINIARDGHSLEPGLAEGGGVSEDGLRAEIEASCWGTLRWLTALDAHAVKASFERQFTGDLKDPKKRVLGELIEGWRFRTSSGWSSE
jgi:hypothetical protein